MIHCITYPGGTEHEKMAYIIRNKVDVQPGIKERKSMKEQSTKAVAKKKFFKMVFSRAGIFVILILVQMLIFLGIPYYLKEYATFIYSVMSLMEIIVLVYIINTEGNPAFKLSWILCVMAVPVVGTIFYIYVHLQLETRFVQNRLAALRMETEPYMDHRCTLGGKICKCTAVVLSVASTGISDLQEYRSRIFSGWRSQIRIHDKRTGKGGKVYFHGVLHRRRRYHVEYDP